MKPASQDAEGSLSIQAKGAQATSTQATSTQVTGAQVMGVLETDVSCIFLGRVWEMRSPRLSFIKKVDSEATNVERHDHDSKH